MTTQYEILSEAMQYARRELGISYADFGRWSVKDAGFHARVKRGTRLRPGEYGAALAFSVRHLENHIALLECELGREQRQAA